MQGAGAVAAALEAGRHERGSRRCSRGLVLGAEGADGARSDGRDVSSGGLLLGVGVRGAGGGLLQYARQVDMGVLDFDLTAAVAECAGKDFGEAACTFPD